MKQAFDRTGARHRDTFHSLGSFYAKRLSLVEHLKKNALNKEIRRVWPAFQPIWKPLVNHVCRSARGPVIA
jgi:hypothetical protein